MSKAVLWFGRLIMRSGMSKDSWRSQFSEKGYELRDAGFGKNINLYLISLPLNLQFIRNPQPAARITHHETLN
jgi:hypothetical protein